MDEERIERALRAGPPDEPVYVPRGAMRPRGRRRIWLSSVAPALRLAASVAIVLAVVLGIVALRSGRLPEAAATPPPSADQGLLEEVRARGVLRVAVTPDYPQIQVAGGVYDGFDVAVAKALAARLGVNVEFQFLPQQDIESARWDRKWDVALGVPSIAARAPRRAFSTPYAWWPALVTVRDPAVVSLDGLAGRRACVVDGSVPHDWLRRALPSGAVASAMAPPPDATIVTRASETDCLTAGEVDFAVTDRSLRTTIETTGTGRLLDRPAFGEPVAVAFDLDGPAADSLRELVDSAIADLRSDGTLAALSRQQLGGLDLTAVPR